MREIKFRGKEVETGQWVYGKLIENKNKGKGLFSGYHYIVPFDIIPYAGNNEHTITSGGYPDYAEDDYSHCWKERKALTIAVIEVDNDTIGQYTGLKDKNGKEIYEGDAWEDEEGFYIVVWDEERACFCVDIYGFDEWIGEGGQECYGNQIELLDREILYFWGDISKIEVTKNIYDNPELLEV